MVLQDVTEDGRDERTLRLADLLDLIKDEKLTMVVFMDMWVQSSEDSSWKKAETGHGRRLRRHQEPIRRHGRSRTRMVHLESRYRLPSPPDRPRARSVVPTCEQVSVLRAEAELMQGVSQGLAPLYIPVIDAPTSVEDQLLPLVSAKVGTPPIRPVSTSPSFPLILRPLPSSPASFFLFPYPCLPFSFRGRDG